MPQGMMPHWVMPEMHGPPDMAYGMGGQPDTTQQYGMIGELGMIGPQPGMLPGMMPWVQYRMPGMQYPHMMPATMPGMMVDVDALTAVEDRRREARLEEDRRREARLEARLHVGQVHDARRQSGDFDSDESDEVDAGLVTEALQEIFRTPARRRRRRCRSRSVAAQRRAAAINNL